MPNKIVVLIPVYNDWESLSMLLAHMKSTFMSAETEVTYIIINDGSTLKAPEALPFTPRIIHLTRNLGHQKAIAVGLAYIQKTMPQHDVLIMDADGEDQPEDALKLIEIENRSDTVIFAKRKKRKESLWFLTFYKIYKTVFRILTGKTIAYGNFMLISNASLSKLVHYSEIWNSLPAAILKAGLNYRTIDTSRGKRLKGRSTMSFYALVLHGLGAVSVFIDRISSRLLMLSVFLILLCIIGIGATLYIRAFTDLAIPGWTSTILFSLFIVLLQVFLVSLFTVFLYLSSQAQRKLIPARHYEDYISEIQPF